MGLNIGIVVWEIQGTVLRLLIKEQNSNTRSLVTFVDEVAKLKYKDPRYVSWKGAKLKYKVPHFVRNDRQ